MAQLAVAGGGAAIGAALGSVISGVGTLLGAQVGWALGGVAGALLFPPKGKDSQGPRLTDLSVQTSGYGLPIPTAVGRVKLAGNLIWKTDIEEQATRRRQGKGGSRPTTTTYSYSLSWAVGLCEWLIPTSSAQVLKIWLDDKLVYDTTGASAVTQVPGLTWRFHPGSEDQHPNPLIAAIEGASEAPAHRGLAYIVFERVPLEKFGKPWLRQIRCTEPTLMPPTLAIAGAVQCVVSPGGSDSVSCTSCSRVRERQLHYAFNDRRAEWRDARRAGPVAQQASHTGPREPLLPAPGGGLVHARLAHDLGRAVAIGGEQYDPGALDMLLRALGVVDDGEQPLAVADDDMQKEPDARTPDSHTAPPRGTLSDSSVRVYPSERSYSRNTGTVGLVH